ncbi:hypothetical protein MLD52_09420 [Puniceicoccaceae bacterium K14]|nr:hypothetical protein [Puniceicoccaceae bacterium K14]
MLKRPRTLNTLIALALCVSLAACVSSQTTSFKIDDRDFPEKPDSFEIVVFEDELPDSEFTRIAHLNYHIEKTFFGPSGLKAAFDDLKKQARKVGADAIIEVKKTRSMLNETLIFNVSAVAIVFEE